MDLVEHCNSLSISSAQFDGSFGEQNAATATAAPVCVFVWVGDVVFPFCDFRFSFFVASSVLLLSSACAADDRSLSYYCIYSVMKSLNFSLLEKKKRYAMILFCQIKFYRAKKREELKGKQQISNKRNIVSTLSLYLCLSLSLSTFATR